MRLMAKVAGMPKQVDVYKRQDVLSQVLRFPTLSTREREILQWAAAGKSNQVIGDILGISNRTVEVHLR